MNTFSHFTHDHIHLKRLHCFSSISIAHLAQSLFSLSLKKFPFCTSKIFHCQKTQSPRKKTEQPRKMSQHVVVTRTSTTPNSSSTIIAVAHYLMVVQLVLGLFVLGIFWYFTNQYKLEALVTPTRLLFFAIPVAFAIGNFCFLFASFLSFNSGGVIFQTTHDLIYHTVALVSYLSITIAFFVEVLRTIRSSDPIYNGYLTSSIIGIIVSGLYFISTFLTFKFCRNF
ncbi:uncharacterized protein LOC132262679 isoform X2 [Phlebotomus argentipes]|uniref:uncharacterized protein LOC132262679 isoform X2 n=1 Tax=Phlebotomus argentipes TaxID=94469 RepID=UPI0028937B70|nr:uncharacterized protein LOC132262679 isoform X2 [Phlebotomus argentipes]